MPRRRLWFVLLAVVLVVNLVIGFRVYSVESENVGEREAFEKIGVMMRVLHLLRKDYVNADRIDLTDLIYSGLRGMVSSLDPFSSFMPPDEYRDMMETTEGQFGGLGIIVTIRDQVPTIVTPIEDTPGSRAGLLAGDRIVKIDGEATKEMDLQDTVKRLKGPPGTTVTLTIHRPSTDKTLDFTIERALIPVTNVKDTRMVDRQIGYIRIVQFNEPTADKLREALSSLLGQGAEAFVIDLRNNPGGLLESAVDVCSLFLPPKTLIVSTEGRQPSQKREFLSTRPPLVMGKPIALLINQGSASAAEIMAGCLQDWGHAVLIGEKTFGKGSVQNVIELPDGSALRLTTAMYYTPSRRVIHERGIAPDIEVTLSEEEVRRLIEQQPKPGDGGAVADGSKPAEDRQLQRAIETLKSYDIYLRATRKKPKTLRVYKDEAKP